MKTEWRWIQIFDRNLHVDGLESLDLPGVVWHKFPRRPHERGNITLLNLYYHSIFMTQRDEYIISAWFPPAIPASDP